MPFWSAIWRRSGRCLFPLVTLLTASRCGSRSAASCACVPGSPSESRWGWLGFASVAVFAAAATACLLVAAAFFAGRQREHRNTPDRNELQQRRAGANSVWCWWCWAIIWTAPKRLLVELKHADPSTEVPLQADARDLLSANRLYRESAKSVTGSNDGQCARSSGARADGSRQRAWGSLRRQGSMNYKKR